MIALVDVLAAARGIRPYIRHTPLIRSPFLSELTGGDIWLKLECWQPTGSFKVRGALNKLRLLTADEKARGIVTASAGNHGLGVAHAATSLGDVNATIFVPETAPQAKVAKLRRYPVTLHQRGATYEDAHQAAADFAAQTGALEISAYDDVEVIAGQGTMALEMLADLPQVDVVLVPVGGGGMLAGVATVLRTMSPNTQLVGVQPQASPAALFSYRDGVAYDPFDHEPTLADGLAGGFGATPFAVTRSQPPQIVLSSEDDMKQAIFALLAQHQLVVEPSGAIAIAPLLAGEMDLGGKTAVCILSGANLDMGVLQEVVGGQWSVDGNR